MLRIARAGVMPYVAALAAVAIMTGLIGTVLSYKHIANISMLYLIVVLAVAMTLGRGPAILASVTAVLVFNWFFVEPLHSLTIANPAEWIALPLFLLTAIITGQLAAGLRERAAFAAQREREAVVLYDVVRLMGEADFDQALHSAAERLRNELELAAVGIVLADGGTHARAAAGHEDALDLVRVATKQSVQFLAGAQSPTAANRGKPGRWVRLAPPRAPGFSQAGTELLHAIPVLVREHRVGMLMVVRPKDRPSFGAEDDRLLSAVATQLGLAFERVRLQREATEGEILRRADDLKTALLNAVSHDLRTPLTSIIASAASLKQRDVSWTDEERYELAEAIEEEALRLNHIVGNLLDLSRIEGGNLRPEKDWYDIGTLVDEVLGRLRPLTAHHEVTVSIADDLPPVRLDYVEIDQVLSNLIENATKYAPPGARIEVKARKYEREAQVEIADNGPGIPAAELPRLFEPFFRGGEASRPPGTGLGLAVAKGLVEAHGGRIWAVNRRDGGVRFIFSLPLASEPVAGSQREA